MQENNYSNQPYQENSYGIQGANPQVGYGGSPYGAPGMQTSGEKQGFGIAAMVLGILSMTLCAAFGSFVGILGMIFGIIGCARREKNRVFAIIGMVTSGVGVIIGCVVVTVFVRSVASSAMELQTELDTALEDLSHNDAYLFFAEKEFVAGDDSVIYFSNDGTFVWYRDDANHLDNYYTGTYEAHRGEKAVNYVTEELSDYAVTEEELEDYFVRNEGDDFYTRENYTVLTLCTEEAIIDGSNQVTEPYEKHYMGFMEDGYYDAANMDSGEYASFTER